MMETRREFLMRCVGTVALSATPQISAGAAQDSVPQSGGTLAFAAGIRANDSQYQLMTGTLPGLVRVGLALPGRGHDSVYSPNGRFLVVFGRRPQRWFVVVDGLGKMPTIQASADGGRHFYGHGRFNQAGTLLYVTENDYNNAIGLVGVYDALAGFRKLGEFPSYGLGPHDLAMLPDDKTLVVANGGIETHPDFGREKLNLATMRSSLAVIDASTGRLLETFNTPESLQPLSLRHLAVSVTGDCFFAGQYQQVMDDGSPILGCVRSNGVIEYWKSEAVGVLMKQYVSSIAWCAKSNVIVATSANGGAVVFMDAETGLLRRQHRLVDCSGVAASSTQILVTSAEGMHVFTPSGYAQGRWSSITDTGSHWDNHLAVRPSPPLIAQP